YGADFSKMLRQKETRCRYGNTTSYKTVCERGGSGADTNRFREFQLVGDECPDAPGHIGAETQTAVFFSKQCKRL
ncbi:hypothetical protein scyTo_0020400, partial [Scyliorhinus torazame]|nr:hypothetical protein [Scyliorhinus torazame]